MTAVALLARANARRHWRGLVVLTLLIGIAGAAVLASAAGARRTATSLERFRGDTRAADVELDLSEAPVRNLDEFRRDPSVEVVGVLRQVMLLYPGTEEVLPSVAARDRRFGTVVDRARVLEGRLPRPASAREIAINEGLASRLHKGVGETVTFDSYSPDQVERTTLGAPPGPSEGPKVRLDIVGLVRRPRDLGIEGAAGQAVFLTPGFEARYHDEIGGYVPALLRVRTTGGDTAVAEAVKTARRVFGASLFQVVGLRAESSGAADAIDVLVTALWIFAGVAALAGLTAVGIVTFRQIGNEERDQYVLEALGLTTRQRAIAAGTTVLPAASLGGVLAVVGAALISPMLPFGLARQAEADPGFHLDAFVLGLGLVAIISFVVVVAAAAGRRVAGSVARDRDAHGGARPSTASRISTRARATPAMTTGLRLALESGRGQLAVPVRTAIVGATLGTLGIVAVLVFGASLDHLVTSPRLYGWAWDTSLTGADQPQQRSEVCGDVTTGATRDPAFSAVAAICREGIEVAGRPVTGWSFTSLRGSIEPVVAAGRAPAAPDEVALGRELLDAADKKIGDSVRISGEKNRRFRIVGQAVLPNPELTDSEPLASGAAFTGPGLMRILRPNPPNVNILARLAPGVDPDRLDRTPTGQWKFAGSSGAGPILPVEVARLHQVDRLPLALAGLLGLLAVVAVAHAIVLAIRRRRRELAVLRTMGFTSRTVRATIAYQATILTLLGLLVGIPAGVAVGRAVWRIVAEGLGVVWVVDIPALELAVLAIVALVIANVIGALAATSAIHDRPAAVLSAE